MKSVLLLIALGHVASADPANTRGRAILNAQLAAVVNWNSSEAMGKTFTKDAIVLTPPGERAGLDNLASRIADLNPHSAVTGAKFDHFTSGGNDKVSWFTAELHFTVVNSEPEYQPTTDRSTVRVIELLDGAADWKAAVAGFTKVSKLQTASSAKIADANEQDTLVKLLVTPTDLAAVLDPKAVVMGSDPEERGEGAGATLQVAKWKNLVLALDGKSREIHTETYGYAMANIKMTTKKDIQVMNAFVLAIPGPNHTWDVVAASYGATW